MSIRVTLDNAPEFYTNLDYISGQIVLGLSRPEQIGAIVVKLEGESKTALAAPNRMADDIGPGRRAAQPGEIVQENHKILYKVRQVFPDADAPPFAGPAALGPGQYQWPFRFRVPFNNACGDPEAMARIGGLAGAGGFASGPGLFGLGGIRVMDGSKQLMYAHITRTLPPSCTGFPGVAEIRYYIKVTVQRPGLFRENWRYNVGFKFLPVEPPRPPPSAQEAYARRPFTFAPRSPGPSKAAKRQSFFGSRTPDLSPAPDVGDKPPSIEISARLPHPAVLTCNKPVPLRLIAKKLIASREQCYLVSLEIHLVGSTHIRSQDLVHTETTTWVVVSRRGLCLPLCRPEDPSGSEMVLPDEVWRSQPLPNTVMPSFVTCNISRTYQLVLRLGVTWGLPQSGASNFRFGKGKEVSRDVPQSIFLPLHFASVDVYSGLTPPASFLAAMRQNGRPSLPPRPTAAQSRPARPPSPASESLYPPQLRPGEMPEPSGAVAPPYEEAPPSYNEAMAESMTGPIFPPGHDRPAYSGVTNENAPDSLPEKR